MFKKLLCVLLLGLFVNPIISQESVATDHKFELVSANKTDGLELPADQTISADEGFLTIQAKCKGDVKWLIISSAKVKYMSVPQNTIVLSVPRQPGTVVSVFAVGLVDGKMTEFARTNITVSGENPTPLPPVPPGPNPPVPPPINPTVVRPVHFTFIADLNNTTTDLAKVLNSESIKTAITAKGNIARTYDLKAPILSQKKLDQVISKVGGNAVLVIQGNNGAVLEAVAIPRTETEVLAIINRWGGQ